MTGSGDSAPGVRLPGLFRAAGIIAGKDLRVELRTLEALTAMTLFSLIVLVIFNFAFGTATARGVGTAQLVPGVLWTVFAFAAVVGVSRSFQGELHNDTLTALRLAPVDRGALFTGKMLANLARVLALEIVVLPLSAVLLGFDLPAALPPLLVVVPLHTVGLVVVGTLLAAVAARLGRGETLVATLLFPFCVPLFLSAVRCTSAALGGTLGGGLARWLAIAGGFDVLFFLVALVTVEYVLED